MNKAVVLLLVLLSASRCLAQDVIAGVVAWVNDKVITTTDVNREVQNRLAAAGEYSNDELQAALPELQKAATEYLVDRKIRAGAVRSALTEQQIEGLNDFAIERQEELARMAGSRAAFRAQLSERGMTLERHRDLIIETILYEEARRRALPTDKVPVSPAETKTYYYNHPEEFIQPAWVTLHQIMIRFSGRTRDEAWTLIQAAQARLRESEPFEKVARELSEGPKAESGGLWEHLQKGSLRAELDEAAFSIPVGAPSEVIETDVGLHLMLVEQRHPDTLVPFEQAADRIEKLLRQERAAARLREWLQSLSKVAYVEVAGMRSPTR